MPTMAAVKVDGKKIQRLREEKLMSRAELAREAGIHPEHVTRLERGITTQPRMATIRGLVKALGIEPSELLAED